MTHIVFVCDMLTGQNIIPLLNCYLEIQSPWNFILIYSTSVLDLAVMTPTGVVLGVFSIFHGLESTCLPLMIHTHSHFCAV